MKRVLLSIVAMLAMLPAAISAQSADTVLRTADAFRAPFSSMGVTVTARTKSSKGTEVRSYSVAFKGGENTLIGFEKPETSRGDLVLMAGDDIYFYAQNTRKPIRITPMQRLTGAVSYGDIARLSWSRDYKVSEMTPETYKGKAALKLDLAARTRGATYQRIFVWVDKKSYRPIGADVYLQSGKLFKTLTFTRYGSAAGRPVNTELQIVDHLNSKGSSTLSFSNVRSANWPNRLFVRTGLPNVDIAELR